MGVTTVHADSSEVKIEYETEDRTRLACAVGLGVSILLGLASTIGGVYVSSRSFILLTPGFMSKDGIPLAINILLALCTESLGFIHATTLKWSLFREHRLQFNANLRLLTYSRKSTPNNIYFNLLFLVALGLAYTSSSFIIVTTNVIDDSISALSGPSLICLGLSLLSMATISLWCFFDSHIPTWSSCPLTTLSVALHHGVNRREGRGMMGVHDHDLPSQPLLPRERQRAMLYAHGEVKKVVFWLFMAWIGLIVWACLSAAFVPHLDMSAAAWDFLPNENTSAISINTGTDSDAGRLPGSNMRMFCGILMMALLQSVVTVGTHCAELVVTLARDEDVWRWISIGSFHPVKPRPAFLRTITSSFSLVLIIFKPILQWQFGLAINVDSTGAIYFNIPQLCYLCMMWAIFLAFVIGVALRRPHGALPATYGHLQTMVDIVDEWGAELHWGDKGEAEVQEADLEKSLPLRRVGTSSSRLGEIEPHALYI